MSPQIGTKLLKMDGKLLNRDASGQKAAATKIGFLLMPGFPLMAYASAMEPLRGVARLAERQLYDCRPLSLDGGKVQSSGDLVVDLPNRLEEARACDILFVCAGNDAAQFADPALGVRLRALSRAGVQIGGISGGPYILARAGLLEGYRFTMNWVHFAAFSEEFPTLHPTASLFELDRGRFTCAGGTAAFDMSLSMIARDHGSPLSAQVGEWFSHTIVRTGNLPQRIGLREKYGSTSRPLLAALTAMESRLEEPYTRDELAEIAGVSARQLERLFQQYLHTSIGRHYLQLRLKRAERLLQVTSMNIAEVAIASGFVSFSHFSRTFKDNFGASPRVFRRKY